MLGVILCGGLSSRMGSDKGLLKLEAKTWAQTAIDKMNGLNIPVKISVNKNQYADYASIFLAADLITDDSSLSIKGPLLGVLSCHLQFPTEALFVLACDMPLMEPVLLKELYQQYQSSAADACLFTNDGEPEPLCGIYSAKGLSAILTMFCNNELTKHSMKFMLDHLTVDAIALKEEQKKCFRNFNAHAELNGL
ncbi:MAG: molybdenum cofactor guanylyltransferase [Sphingobacteriales bacterium]|nr:molybdenum cofactor guanylyltransferase [Sphingobacteriales bacterium]MBI3717674.1 molybdenum cofactor guanylyltransferase [Sphingobacteriales bacterium]